MEILNNIEMNKLNLRIQNLQSEKATIQNTCPHENATYKYKGNTGNYDPSADHYWADIVCLDCGKRWSLEQGKEFYDLCRKHKGWSVLK